MHSQFPFSCTGFVHWILTETWSTCVNVNCWRIKFPCVSHSYYTSAHRDQLPYHHLALMQADFFPTSSRHLIGPASLNNLAIFVNYASANLMGFVDLLAPWWVLSIIGDLMSFVLAAWWSRARLWRSIPEFVWLMGWVEAQRQPVG